MRSNNGYQIHYLGLSYASHGRYDGSMEALGESSGSETVQWSWYLFGGECKEAIKICDDLQNFFWRVMLKVPESCPQIALRCEPRMIGMKWRVWQEKILLLLRIKQQAEDSISRQVYEDGGKGLARPWFRS